MMESSDPDFGWSDFHLDDSHSAERQALPKQLPDI
jgi:hypothetical protein